MRLFLLPRCGMRHRYRLDSASMLLRRCCRQGGRHQNVRQNIPLLSSCQKRKPHKSNPTFCIQASGCLSGGVDAGLLVLTSERWRACLNELHSIPEAISAKQQSFLVRPSSVSMLMIDPSKICIKCKPPPHSHRGQRCPDYQTR